MKISISLSNTDGPEQDTLKSILGSALNAKGFTSQTAFGREVAKKLGTTPHGETAALNRIVMGKVKKIEPQRAEAYAEILGIAKENLLKCNDIIRNESRANKPFHLDAKQDVASVIKKLSQKQSVSAEDLMKELLWLAHQ